MLLILAVIWAAVLVPPMLRARAEGRPSDSIGEFHRHLSVLSRTGPVDFSAANRLYANSPAPYVSAGPWTAARLEARRRRTVKRRRDILVSLLAGMAGTLVLGLVPALRELLYLHLMLDLLFAGYVALLVRMRNVAAEREMKLRFLPSTGPGMAEPVFALQRSAN